MRRGTWTTWVWPVLGAAMIAVGLFGWVSPVRAQETGLSEATVRALVEGLSDEDFERRSAAAERLVAAGPGIRGMLESLRAGLPVEGRLRLDTVMARWDRTPGPGRPIGELGTRITCDLRDRPLAEVLARLSAAAGTPIQVADPGRGGPPGSRPTTLVAENRPFFQVLDELCGREGLRHERQGTGELLVLASPAGGGPVSYLGPLRVAVSAFSVTRMTNFSTEPTIHANLQLTVDMENPTPALGLAGPPRLTRARDDRGRPVLGAGAPISHLVALSASRRAHLSLALAPPARDAVTLTELDLELALVVHRELAISNHVVSGSLVQPSAPVGPASLVIEEHTPLDGHARIRLSWTPHPPECEEPSPLRVPPHSRVRFLDGAGNELPAAGAPTGWISGAARAQTFTVPGGPVAEIVLETVARYAVETLSVRFTDIPLP